MSEHIRDGIKDGLVVSVALIPLACVFAIGAVAAKFTLLEALLMSLVVVAATSQVVAVGLIAAGATLPAILLSTFIINARFILVSISIAPYLEKAKGVKRAILSHPILSPYTGLIPARAQSGKPCEEYMLALNLMCLVAWVTCTALGFVLRQIMPAFLQKPLDFALPASFIAFMISMLGRKLRKNILVVLAAGALTLGLYPIAGSWSFIVGAIIGATAGTMVKD